MSGGRAYDRAGILTEQIFGQYVHRRCNTWKGQGRVDSLLVLLRATVMLWNTLERVNGKEDLHVWDSGESPTPP
jgi:hypothetical protein